jgi:hypothetical protein
MDRPRDGRQCHLLSVTIVRGGDKLLAVFHSIVTDPSIEFLKVALRRVKVTGSDASAK